MSIQLISLSHKTADLNVRSCFSMSLEQQKNCMKAIYSEDMVEECVILSTCNRLEIYLYGKDEDQRQIFKKAENHLFSQLDLPDKIDGAEYLRFYSGKKAVEHLFLVASGLDSQVIGEDQILGQVKDAQAMASEAATVGTFLNTCFRYAITAAKKIKTETELSKTAVSTATIAIKAARDALGTLKQKKVLIIGASGKIGGSVYKNLLSDNEAKIYITQRQKCKKHASEKVTVIDYSERYAWLEPMDVIISATASPHYTLTFDKVKGALQSDRERVFVDLAVPPDIDGRVLQLEHTHYYNLDDFTKIAEENNRRKKHEAAAALDILEDYCIQFEKWMIFQTYYSNLEEVRENICGQAKRYGAEKAFNRFFYTLRDCMEPDELEIFMKTLKKIGDME